MFVESWAANCSTKFKKGSQCHVSQSSSETKDISGESMTVFVNSSTFPTVLLILPQVFW